MLRRERETTKTASSCCRPEQETPTGQQQRVLLSTFVRVTSNAAVIICIPRASRRSAEPVNLACDQRLLSDLLAWGPVPQIRQRRQREVVIADVHVGTRLTAA